MNRDTIKELERLLERKFNERLKPLFEKVEVISAKIDETLASISFLSEKYDNLIARVGSLEGQNNDLECENRLLRKEISTLASNLQTTRIAVNELEQYSRRDCLEIKGIPESREKSTTEIVITVGALMDIDVKPDDISISHWLPTLKLAARFQPKPWQNTPTPSIIVKFTRRDVRDRFYSARKHLREKTVADLGITRSENKIFVSESLSSSNKELFKSSLTFKRDFKFKYIWTHAGRIYLRRTQDSPALIVTSPSDLDKYAKRCRPIEPTDDSQGEINEAEANTEASDRNMAEVESRNAGV